MTAHRLAPLVLLAACSGTAGGDKGDCAAGRYGALVGRPLAAVTLPADLKTRVVRPGEVVTMEYVADRMTIEVDAKGIVTTVRCG